MRRLGSRSEQQEARKALANQGIHNFSQLKRAVRKNGHEQRAEILDCAPLVFPDNLADVQDLQRGRKPQSH